jgi:hypothetical protein
MGKGFTRALGSFVHQRGRSPWILPPIRRRVRWERPRGSESRQKRVSLLHEPPQGRALEHRNPGPGLKPRLGSVTHSCVLGGRRSLYRGRAIGYGIVLSKRSATL